MTANRIPGIYWRQATRVPVVLAVLHLLLLSAFTTRRCRQLFAACISSSRTRENNKFHGSTPPVVDERKGLLGFAITEVLSYFSRPPCLKAGTPMSKARASVSVPL